MIADPVPGRRLRRSRLRTEARDEPWSGGDKSQLKSGGQPVFQATLTPKAGEANLKTIKVTLPLSLALDPNNATGFCEFADGLKDQCPAGSIVGTAVAKTPLLD